MTSLVKVSDKQWNVCKADHATGHTHVFAIVETDQHTAQMLHDFQSSQEKLDNFGDLIIEHGAGNAYRVYNGMEPISPPETDE